MKIAELAKKHFSKSMGTMFNFCAEKGKQVLAEGGHKKRVIFTTHPRDIRGPKMPDLVHGSRYLASNCFASRGRVAIRGLDYIPDDVCLRRSTGAHFVGTGFDVLLPDIDDSYFVRIGTRLANDIVRAEDSVFLEVAREAEQNE